MSANGQTGDTGWYAKGFPTEKLSQHFQKHGKEFNCTSNTEYNNKAVAFMNSKGESVDSFKSEENSIYKYNYDTNEFGIAKTDGTIITYFKPSAREAYWIRQREEHEK